MLQLIINRKRKSEHILSQQKVRKSLKFAQNEEEYKNNSDNEYESQPIISVKSSFRKCGQHNAVCQ